MIGQYSDEEFREMYNKSCFNSGYSKGNAVVRYGKYTYNYYIQHSDKSWTNYNCRTIY